MKRSLFLLRLALLFGVALTWAGCYYDDGYYPPQYTPLYEEYYFIGGPGTGPFSGALEININPDGYYNPNQFYDVELVGVDYVPLGPGPYQRVLFSFLPPGRYRLIFSANCYDPWDYNCLTPYVDRFVDIYPGQTTQSFIRPY